MSFEQALNHGPVLLMDAAMGTQLGEVASAGWNHLARIRTIHEEAVAAGAEVLLTATFQANPPALSAHNLEDQLDRIIARSIMTARHASNGRFVLGSIGPILSPGKKYEEFADRDALRRTVSAFQRVDGLLFETCSTPAVLSAAQFTLHRIEEVEDLPLLVSLTYHRDPSGNPVTFSGHAPESYARNAIRHGVSALGVNCGKDLSVEDLVEILRRYREETDLPLFVRPNAGTPDGEGRYTLTPEMFAKMATTLIEAGVRMIGGCCGTTAAHLAAVPLTSRK